MSSSITNTPPGISEINLSTSGESPATALKTVQVGNGSSSSSSNNNNYIRSASSPTPTSSGSTSVNKIDISHDKESKIGGARPDRTVPVDDLSLLVDHNKTKAESDPFSTSQLQKQDHVPSSPFTVERTPTTPLFNNTAFKNTTQPTTSAHTLNNRSDSTPFPTTTTTSPVPTLLDETTDLSGLLNKNSTTDTSFAFKPSINVSTDTALPTPTANKVSMNSATSAVHELSSSNPTNVNNNSNSVSKNSFFSSLFKGKADGNSTSSHANTDSSSASVGAVTPNSVRLPKTDAEIQKEKQDLLFKLNRLQERGMPISRKYTMSSPIEDIRSEFLSLKSQRDIQNSVKFQRKMMMAVVTGVEFMNTKFDPFDIKLDGWSESIHENINDYDEIFEELHEKHKEKAKMAPETKLFFSLAGSAFMFHLTQSLFKTGPGIDNVMQQNPELMKQFAQAAVGAQQRQMGGVPDVSPGLGHEQVRGTAHRAQPSMGMGGGMGGLLSGIMGGGGGGGGLGGMMSGLMGSGGGGHDSGSDAGSSYGASEIKRHQMTGPKGVDDILTQLSVPPSNPPPVHNTVGNINSASRLANVTRADEVDIAQLGTSMRRMDTASSGYRKSISDGMKLNL